MEAHAIDLRSEVDDEALVEAVKTDWRQATLNAADGALLEYSQKLTVEPQSMGQEDVDRLRAAGFDDAAIHDATQVVSYFNYINRIADGLGTDPEEMFPPHAST